MSILEKGSGSLGKTTPLIDFPMGDSYDRELRYISNNDQTKSSKPRNKDINTCNTMKNPLQYIKRKIGSSKSPQLEISAPSANERGRRSSKDVPGRSESMPSWLRSTGPILANHNATLGLDSHASGNAKATTAAMSVKGKEMERVIGQELLKSARINKQRMDVMKRVWQVRISLPRAALHSY